MSVDTTVRLIIIVVGDLAQEEKRGWSTKCNYDSFRAPFKKNSRPSVARRWHVSTIMMMPAALHTQIPMVL